MRFKLNHMLFAIAVIAAVLALLSPFRGMFPPFYYEQFNTVARKLDAIEGLVIVSSWTHEDIILEDCGFEVVADGQRASITFIDHQDWAQLFDEADGIRVSVQNQQYLISREQLNTAGFNVVGLKDILRNFDGVSDFCRTQAKTQTAANSTDQYVDHWKYVKIKLLD